MEIKTDAVVVQTIDYKDDDKLLTLFSPSLGKITAGIRGVKKPKAKLAFAAQPFAFCEYVLAEKAGRYTVVSAYLHESFFEVRSDVERFYAACASAELVRTVSVENERFDSLFVGFVECLKALCLAGEDVAESLVSFMLVALRESGYPIDLSHLEDGQGETGEKLWFDFADGQFTSFERCQTGERASLSTYHTLRKCAGLSFDEATAKGGKKRALRLLKAFLTEKTEERYAALGDFIRLYEDSNT